MGGSGTAGSDSAGSLGVGDQSGSAGGSPSPSEGCGMEQAADSGSIDVGDQTATYCEYDGNHHLPSDAPKAIWDFLSVL